ncbi:MAG: PolC-type DNA polymerase III [Oscillospiraceae bacterium]|nr:PolC-type DNA polymerase III [Oscillospiraceae bacterium]
MHKPILETLGQYLQPNTAAELSAGVVVDCVLDRSARSLTLRAVFPVRPSSAVLQQVKAELMAALMLSAFSFIVDVPDVPEQIPQQEEPSAEYASSEPNAAGKSNKSAAKKSESPQKKKLGAQKEAVKPNVLPECLRNPRLVLGETITQTPIPTAELTRPREFAVIWGEIFKLECKNTKSGTRRIISFNVTDYTDSLPVRLFKTVKQCEGFEKHLREGSFVLLAGGWAYDEYLKQNVFTPDSIVTADYAHRADTAPEKRVELHLHTKISAMDGVSSAAKLVERAAYWGHKSVAITDHGVVQAFPEAAKAGEEYGVKIVYGCEGYYVDGQCPHDPEGAPPPGSNDQYIAEVKKAKSYHIIVLAKTRAGLKNLYRLISKSNMDYFYRKPRMPRAELERFRDGLIIGSACEAGELYRAVLDGKSHEELLDIAAFYDYIEIMPLGNNAFMTREYKTRDGVVHPPRLDGDEPLREINRTLASIAQELGKPLVATGDVHFLDERDSIFREILQAGQSYDDASYQAPLFFKTTDEMLEEFAYLGEETAYAAVVTNPNAIADSCEDLLPIPEGTFAPEIPGAAEDLRQVCAKRARELYGDPLPEIVEKRLERELVPIIENGFAVMYITAQKLVEFSHSRGYEVGSRGSVGSSIVASLSGISEVNPLPPHYLCPNCRHSQFITDGSVGSGFDLPARDCPHCSTAMLRDGHDIPFETFLGFNAEKQPDIDLNFSGVIQGDVHRYTEELFGKQNCYKAGTIQVLQDKKAFGFVKKFLESSGRGDTVRRAEIDRLVRGCVGVKSTTGQHPGGMVVVPENMDVEDFTPVQYPADKTERDMMTTQFDFKTMLHDTLLKLDILGHDVPTIYKQLEELTGISVTQADITDRQLYALFQSPEPLGITAAQLGVNTGTLSIPEMGTRNTIQMLIDAKPTCFADLLQISGLSHGTDVWHGNAKELIDSGECTISDVIGLRDNIMLTLMQKGMESGMAFEITEIVRKGKAKALLTPEHVAAMEAIDLPEWYIDSCRKIKYMFPKAHAAAYVIAALRLAWYKLYHPLEYYAVCLTVKGGALEADVLMRGQSAVAARLKELDGKVLRKESTPKETESFDILQIVNEMLLRGIGLLPVDLYRSAAEKYTLEDGKIRIPFSALDKVGAQAAKGCATARETVRGEFISVEDFRNSSRVSVAVMDALRTAGAFEGMPEADQLSLF